jgi:cell division transport system permease protein
MLTLFRRITKTGVITFWRNGWVSFATVLVMVLALFVIGSIILAGVVSESVLAELEEKVDITVYFRLEAPEDEMMHVRDALLSLGEVKDVEYVSREEALQKFRDRHADNTLITQSLDEIGENPLGASLNVQATNPDHYAAISDFLEANAFSTILDKVNFRQNELVIERLSSILSTSRTLGISFSLFLALIAFLVAFNTIRMAIYTSREEIKVMKLVGASNFYTRGPFLVEGFLHGLFASIVALALMFPVTFYLAPRATTFFGGPDIFLYYTNHLPQIFFILFAFGVTLGVSSSYIAVRRYLRV